MARIFNEQKLVIASSNSKKIEEFKQILEPRGIKVLSSNDFADLPEVEETGFTYLENAFLKAHAVAQHLNLPVLADDSGLNVPARPDVLAVKTARWIKQNGGAEQALKLLEGLMDGKDKSACLVCALVIVWPDGHHEFVIGEAEGSLTFPAREGRQFGVDPVFVPEGETRAFSEMSLEEKEALSHRGKAVAALLKKCFR